MLSTNEKYALEALIDKHGIQTIVESVAEIASEKADHIQSNWQDEPLSKQWDKLAAKLLNVALFVKDSMI